MNAINTAKTNLISALDAAGWGFAQYNGQAGGPGAVQVFCYPISPAAKPAAGAQAQPVSGGQKIALIQALEGSYNVGLNDATVWDEAQLTNVSGLVVTLIPVAAD